MSPFLLSPKRRDEILIFTRSASKVRTASHNKWLFGVTDRHYRTHKDEWDIYRVGGNSAHSIVMYYVDKCVVDDAILKTRPAEILRTVNNFIFGGHKVDGCVFCQRETIKSTVLDVDGCYVFEPLDPVCPGHLLVVHPVHTKDFTSDYTLFGKLAEVASKFAAERGGDYNLITSKGKWATQTVPHCHIHLVPRCEGDGIALPWSVQRDVETPDHG